LIPGKEKRLCLGLFVTVWMPSKPCRKVEFLRVFSEQVRIHFGATNTRKGFRFLCLAATSQEENNEVLGGYCRRSRSS